MSETKKAVLVVLEALLCVGAMFAWLPDPGQPPTTVVWVLRWGLLLATVVNLGLLIRAFRQRDRAPDFLRPLRGKIFERDGVCFTICPAKRDSVAYLIIALQNRFASPCDFRIVLKPLQRAFKSFQGEFPGVDLAVDCAGGMLGVIRAPLEVPAAFQGKSITFRVTAQVSYYGRPGAMLRVQTGASVGLPDESQLPAAIITGVSLMLGHFHLFARPAAKAKVVFPGIVCEELPPSEIPAFETLWLPGDPEDGVLERLKQAMSSG